jgi:uncharacterized protein (TIGR02145 family)
MLKKLIFCLMLALPALAFSQTTSYLWSTGDTTASISPVPMVTTTYYVTVTQSSVAYYDSVTIVVNNPSFSNATESAVQSYTWPVNSQTYTQSGTYTDTLSNALGCDSVLTLYLTILPPLSLTTTASDTVVCAGTPVNIGVNFATAGGQYPAGTVHCDPANPTAIVDVTNPTTGKTWMDRNLGASQAATSSTDTAAYGDLYQWGRAADGHQCRNSATTTTLSSTDQPGHGSFITINSGNWDWRSPQNTGLWQGVNGVNNPCPSGYRLPTETEINAERLSWSSNTSAGAFASPLKLPIAGYRLSSSGLLFSVGGIGYYWSSTVSNIYSRHLFIQSGNDGMATNGRAVSYSVRCLKD